MIDLLYLSVLLATSGDVALSPEAQKLIAPVHRAYVEVEEQQKLAGPAKTDRERLERMWDIDQVGRAAFVKVDLRTLPEAEQELAAKQLWYEIMEHDKADQIALKAMIARDGWFTIKQYGSKASQAAFLIVQHATDDPQLMKSVLPELKTLAERGEIDADEYPLLYDRVALEFLHLPQRYGTQVSCEGGEMRPQKLEDPSHLDDRRKAIGLTETETEYLKHFSEFPCSK